MPSGRSLIGFTYVNIMFIVQLFAMVLLSNIANIKKNWPLYRCNPLYMPLSSDITTDFTYCIQNMQSDYFTILVEPLNSILGNLSNLGSGITSAVTDVGGVIDDVRTFATGLFDSVFGIFGNVGLLAERLGMEVIDLVKRLMATLLIAVYTVITGVYSVGNIIGIGTNLADGKSIENFETMSNNNIIGTMIKNTYSDTGSVTGRCFSPNTLLKLNTKELKKIKDIKLGDVLENGSKIIGILILDNDDIFYKCKNKGYNNSDIYITGKHYVKYNDKFMPVEKHPEFKKTNKISSCVYNLMTSDNIIDINNMIFWDYNDDILNYNK